MIKFLRSKLACVTLISIFAKLSSLARDVLFASTYGAGEICSAFEGASKIPLALFDIFFGCAIGSAFIPVFCSAAEAGEGEEERFANGFAGLVLALSSTLTVLGMIFSQSIIVFFAKGVSSAALGSARMLLVLLFPTLFINSFSFLLIAIMHAKDRFVLPACISLVTNVLSIIYLLLGTDEIYGFAMVSVFGGTVQLMMLYCALKKYGFVCRPSFDFSSEYIKSTLSLTLQGFLPCSLTPVMALASLSYADRYPDGRGIALYNYAHRIFMMAAGFFTFIFSAFLLPSLSRLQAKRKNSETGKVFYGYTGALLIILIPITFALIVFPEKIVGIIFTRGKFSPEDCRECAAVLRRLAVGIPFFAFSELSLKAYFARQRCLFPSVCAVAALFVFCGVTVFLPQYLGLEHLALATSATYIVYALMLFAGLKIPIFGTGLSKGGEISND